jgi:hypothetical protein
VHFAIAETAGYIGQYFINGLFTEYITKHQLI